MNHKVLGEIFQGIYDRFGEMKPIGLNELETGRNSEIWFILYGEQNGRLEYQGSSGDMISIWQITEVNQIKRL